MVKIKFTKLGFLLIGYSSLASKFRDILCKRKIKETIHDVHYANDAYLEDTFLKYRMEQAGFAELQL